LEGISISTFGVGRDYNEDLMTSMAETGTGNYYFIDKIEKSGIAYGEILQSILYRAYNGVRIEIENGMLKERSI
jgi:Ca-activated chloride channel family protein